MGVVFFFPCSWRCWKRFGETRSRIEKGGDRGMEDKVERRAERKEKTKRPSCSRNGGLCIDIILGLGLGV